MIKIEDNFLDKKNFNKLQDLMMGPRLQWNFGDGTISTLQNPAHTYSSGGNYIVSLITSNLNFF